MNHVTEWDDAHKARLMIAPEPFPALVQFADSEAVRPTDRLGKALDIGCGTGRSAEYLASRGWITSGFDGSPAAIRRALYRATEKAYHDKPETQFPTFMVADATKPWPYRSQSFDIAVDIRSLENLTKDEICIAWTEMFRVLRPGGWFLGVMASTERNDALTAAGIVSKLNEDDFEILGAMGFNVACTAITSDERGKIVHDWQVVAHKRDL